MLGLGHDRGASPKSLNRAGYASPVRTPRGRDIMAACGQLKSESQKLQGEGAAGAATPKLAVTGRTAVAAVAALEAPA